MFYEIIASRFENGKIAWLYVKYKDVKQSFNVLDVNRFIDRLMGNYLA
jgi:hypothetical protein